jgi:DNA-binding FadR family transcriptional regulator
MPAVPSHASTSKPRRYEIIVRALEQQMINGRIAPGDRLPSERALMEHYGVGRSSVREALFALQRMGLVQLSPGERAYATRPTAMGLVAELSGAARRLLAAPDGVRHFQHARRMLECGLAEEAAKRATPDSLAELYAALEANRRARTLERAIDTDVEFHARIAAMATNPVLTALHTAVGAWLREQRSTSATVSGAVADAARAHQRVYEAIASGDANAARAAMCKHLEDVERYYWQARRAAGGSAPARKSR